MCGCIILRVLNLIICLCCYYEVLAYFNVVVLHYQDYVQSFIQIERLISRPLLAEGGENSTWPRVPSSSNPPAV